MADSSVVPNTDGREFQLTLTPASDTEPAFLLADDVAKNRAVWSELPGHAWGLTGEPKPGAWALATARTASAATDAAKRAEPVIVAQNYGLGQVLWLGIDSTWRWRRRDNERYHHRFWSQMARMAARHKTAAGTGDVQFGPVDADVEAGEDVAIRAQLSGPFSQRMGSAALRAEILNTDGGAAEEVPVRAWKLEPIDAASHLYEARGRSLREGDYLVRLATDPADPQLSAQSTPLRVRAPRSRESLALATNTELLRQIAAAGNGEMLRPGELYRLASLIPAPPANKSIEREIVVWNHPVILMLLFVLLAAEWGWRKRAGLP
jgi:hypothetical protein